MLFTAMDCPRCEKRAVFPTQRKVTIDGEVRFIFSVKCSACGWQPTVEEDIQNFKKWLKECDELQAEEDEKAK